MKRAVFVLIIIAMLISACDESMMLPEFTPTPAATPSPTLVDPVERATFEAQAATQAAQTQAALDVAAIEAQVHLESLRTTQTAVAGSTQAVATAQSFQMTEQSAQITRQAESTATERAWLAQGWTATADASIATATAQAGWAILSAQATQTERAILAGETQVAATATAAQMAFAYQATENAPYLAANATAVAAQAMEAEAAANRTQMTNEFLAWFRIWAPVLLIVILLIASLLVWRSHTRNRIIPRDDRGAAPLVIIDGQMTNPDLMMFPMMDEHAHVSAELQAAHASNMAKVAAVRALPAGNNQTGRRMIKTMAEQSQTKQPHNNFTILPDNDPRATQLLPPNVRTALDQQWHEEGNE